MREASLPVLLLSGSGVVIAALGLVQALTGNVAPMVVGLAALFAGGVLPVPEIAARSRSPRPDEKEPS